MISDSVARMFGLMGIICGLYLYSLEHLFFHLYGSAIVVIHCAFLVWSFMFDGKMASKSKHLTVTTRLLSRRMLEGLDNIPEKGDTLFDREASSNTRLFIKRIVFRYIPKYIRKGFAKLGGYFWAECSLCGEEFGGFEVAGGSVIIEELTSSAIPVYFGNTKVPPNAVRSAKGESICPNCCVRRTSVLKHDSLYL
jgi:hypothetical protein